MDTQKYRDNPEHKLLFELAIAAEDMYSAVDCCDLVLKLRQTDEKVLFTALFDYILLSYARPFMRSNSIKPLNDEWTSWHNQYQKELHKKILYYRNRAAGHNDKKVHRLSLIPETNTDYDGGINIKVQINSKGLDESIIPEIKLLSIELLKRLEPRIGQLKKDIYDQFPAGGISLLY